MPPRSCTRTASYATATATTSKSQPTVRRAAHRLPVDQPIVDPLPAKPPTSKQPTAKHLTTRQPTAKPPTSIQPTPRLPAANLPTANLPTANHAGALGLARSFELVKVELFSVPAHTQVPLDVDVPRSARAVLGTAKRLATLLPDLAKLGGYDLRPVRRLKFYAGAVLYTHILALAAGPEDLQKLAMRDAAYVLFLQAYQHVRHGVMLLRWAENDAGAFLPALCRRRPWVVAGGHGERAPREERMNHDDGTVRLEAAAASPIRHREVSMG